MKRLGFGLVGLIFGYLAAAMGGYALVGAASANRHDGPVEAAMTGAFVTGPLGAIVGAIAGAVLGGRRRPR